MDPNKVGNFILKLRKDNNLTQQEFADMFGVTYQAVSKWENGKNIPDLLILKEICKQFDIDINEILDGKKRQKKKLVLPLVITTSIIILTGLVLLIFLSRDNGDDFEFRTFTSGCSNFNIFGSLAFNNNRSHIYISKIEYCGGDDTTEYRQIEAILFEAHNDIEKHIDSYRTSEHQTSITLEEFLQDLRFHIDNYDAMCPNFLTSELFLQIYATDYDERVISHRIPLNSEGTCPND
jgi:transcriptional regulator with XRE-family HTH domain